MANRIQVRRDTVAGWTAANPVLADGEPGVEKPDGKLKIGDGVTAWTELPYSVGGGGVSSIQADPDYPGLYIF